MKTSNSVATACPNGFWSVEGEGACPNQCPRGFCCSAGVKALCPAGSFCAPGTGPCASAVPCTAGFYCPEGTEYEIPCPSGSFSLAGQGTCTITTPGFYAPR